MRVDFGGGWTDVPPYPEEQGGFVCNVAIARYATVTLSDGATAQPDPRRANDQELALARAVLAREVIPGPPPRLEIASDFPVGAGLGGSSAAGVAAVGALAAWGGSRPAPAELAERSRAIEVDGLGIAGGRQDHYAAAFGGALALEFGNTVTVRRIPVAADVLNNLAERMLVLYTGRSRISGATISAVLDAYHRRDAVVVAALARSAALARQMAASLETGALEDLGRLVGEQWVHQRALHPLITTAEIDRIVTVAARAGAWGAKALGASGGGCVVVLGEKRCLEHVARETGGFASPLPAGIDQVGFRVHHHTLHEGITR